MLPLVKEFLHLKAKFDIVCKAPLEENEFLEWFNLEKYEFGEDKIEKVKHGRSKTQMKLFIMMLSEWIHRHVFVKPIEC